MLSRSRTTCFWQHSTRMRSIRTVDLRMNIHNDAGIHMKAGRDSLNDTKKPGCTPYAYPHSLRPND